LKRQQDLLGKNKYKEIGKTFRILTRGSRIQVTCFDLFGSRGKDLLGKR
jgi:hypothetical protein